MVAGDDPGLSGFFSARLAATALYTIPILRLHDQRIITAHSPSRLRTRWNPSGLMARDFSRFESECVIAPGLSPGRLSGLTPAPAGNPQPLIALPTPPTYRIGLRCAVQFTIRSAYRSRYLLDPVIRVTLWLRCPIDPIGVIQSDPVANRHCVHPHRR